METKNNKESRIYKTNGNLISFLDKEEQISTKKAVQKVERIQFYYDEEEKEEKQTFNLVKKIIEKFSTDKKSDYDNKYNWIEVSQ